MKKIRYYSFAILAMSLLSLFGDSQLTAQVTIGSSQTPIEGALLELTQGAETTKGLGMPRVELTDPNSLVDIIPTSTIRPDVDEHIGLMVYNVKESDEMCVGLHVWDGENWILLNQYDSEAGASYNPTTGVLTDRDGEEYDTADFGDAGIWMTQNLRTTSFMKCGEKRTIALNGSSAENADSDSQRQFAYPNISLASSTDPTMYNANKHLGLLYNWCAATNRVNATTDDQFNEKQYQGMCPLGWHVGTLADWRALHKELEKNTSKYSTLADNPSPSYVGAIDVFDAGYHTVAMLSQTHNPLDPSNYPNIGKSNASNNKGFDATRGGYASNGKINSSSPVFLYSNYWTGSNLSAGLAYYHTIEPSSQKSKLAFWNKRNLFFIRCKKSN